MAIAVCDFILRGLFASIGVYTVFHGHRSIVVYFGHPMICAQIPPNIHKLKHDPGPSTRPHPISFEIYSHPSSDAVGKHHMRSNLLRQHHSTF